MEHRKSIILLIVIAIILVALIIYRYAIAGIVMYSLATLACFMTMENQKLHLNFWGFLKKYGWFYWAVSVTLIVIAVGNYNGDKAAEREYYRCFGAAINDTVISIKGWGKVGEEIELSNGNVYKVYVSPYIGKVEERLRQRNIIIAHKKSNNDTICFVDGRWADWQFVIVNPRPKTIFDK